ncbi:hypothetical protein GJ496_000570 [Pomphorhynchus laevis]|nr:hypothetical protein GJ496_000570 [Pomphorhynchus laevis]
MLLATGLDIFPLPIISGKSLEIVLVYNVAIVTDNSLARISNDTSSTDQLLNTKCKDEVFFADDIISPVDKSESSKTNNEPQSSDVNDATQSRSSVISGIEAINILRNIAPISLMCSTKKDPGVNSGCTAIVAVLLENKKLIVANAGDSRGVLCRNGQAVALSQDHNPEVLGERIRIINAGRRVTSDGRIDRGLNLSRSIGDHNYKNNSELPPHMQAIICKPDICVIDIEQDDEFFVLACDGIWNCKTNQQVCDIIREWLPLKSLGQICEDICSQCIAVSTDGDGSGCDNMTIIIVQIKHSTANGQAKQSEIVYGSNSTENRVERSEKFTTTSTPNSDDENRRIMTSLEQPVTDISF